MTSQESGKVLLSVNALEVSFRTERGVLKAVDGVSFDVRRGEILGIVGESGCGKSVTSQAILRLYDEKHLVQYGGEIRYRGDDLLSRPLADMRAIRGNKIAMIFQDPSSSINPVFTIGAQIAETIRMHQKMSPRAAHEKAVEMLRISGIPAPEKRAGEYPHQLSGGMKQRVMIAMALACEPDLLIADEPTTALDVTIQAQILELMQEINRDRAMGIVMITHDLGVVAEMCTRVSVMYMGQVVEEADVDQLFAQPRHPYTQGLLRSIPDITGDRHRDLYVIPGTVPSLQEIPSGCRFAARCQYADQLCRAQPPELSVFREDHKVRCWHHEAIAAKKGGGNA